MQKEVQSEIQTNYVTLWQSSVHEGGKSKLNGIMPYSTGNICRLVIA